MKTAMQELLEFINELGEEKEYNYAVFVNIQAKAIEMIGKEKRQIAEAFDAGADRIIPIEGIQYYNETFKP